ncbi:uncharacterized protein LOC123665588 [Melitaea cinxia]|uniref:uncharacterized protein LOC123665588 n=1 Tax=Melitaea cinxia TaxID=113334 RepID=UPI001E2747D2|nr:uncharacterized protein LOC123665588 [Melitaea cinxia]
MQTKTLYTLLFVAFGLIIGGYSDVAPKNDLEEHVLTLLSKWRQGTLETNLFTLPSIKSIGLEPLNIEYSDGGIQLQITAEDVSLTGIDSFVVESLDVQENSEFLNISGILRIPTLTLSAATYRLSGRAVIIPLRGNGVMTIDVLDASVQVNLPVANVNDEYTKVDDVSLSYSIGQVRANLQRAGLVNNILSSQGPGILEGLQGNVVTALTDWAVPLADQYLAKVTLPELTEIIADLAVTSTVQA